jgi:hypothetical protein
MGFGDIGKCVSHWGSKAQGLLSKNGAKSVIKGGGATELAKFEQSISTALKNGEASVVDIGLKSRSSAIEGFEKMTLPQKVPSLGIAPDGVPLPSTQSTPINLDLTL